MVDIKVSENGFLYLCSLEEHYVYEYIKENKDYIDCVDEERFLKAVYEMWAEGSLKLRADGDGIPNNSPDYGSIWGHEIKSISLSDISWAESNYRTPLEFLNTEKARDECKTAIEKSLGSCVEYVGIDIGGSFYVGIKNASLYFTFEDLSFKSGEFYGEYRLRKNRIALIEKVHNAICNNIKLVKDFYCTYGLKFL